MHKTVVIAFLVNETRKDLALRLNQAPSSSDQWGIFTQHWLLLRKEQGALGRAMSVMADMCSLSPPLGVVSCSCLYATAL
jgi:hypothetical protein